MTGQHERPGDQTTATISGDVSGQIAVGKGITQDQTVTTIGQELSGAEMAELSRSFATLKAQIVAHAPYEKQSPALERVDELEGAVTGDEPDLSTMEYVRNWFARNLPSLAGSVTSLVVHPIVGRLVSAGGDALVGEFRRRFGD